MQSFDDLNNIWRLTGESMRQEFSDTTFNLWFGDMSLVALTDKAAVFSHPSEYKKQIIEKKYLDKISHHIADVLGFDVAVTISSPNEMAQMPVIEPTEEKEKEEDPFAVPSAPHIITPASDAANAYQNGYTFENFVVGKSNEFAYAACLAVANNPSSAYNPLFIHGPSGIGKTHLMYAITNEIAKQRPNTNIIYVKGEEFTNELIDSISRKNTLPFRNKYRMADVLLIDDIQFIAGKEATQEEFFHTFNALYEMNKHIILTSDRPPRDIKTLEDRLRSRFEWGMIADIQPPDFELRIAVLKNKAESMGVNVPNDVLDFLAEKLQSNIRQIEGAIKKLGAKSLLIGAPITLDLARTSISDLLNGTEPINVTIDKVFSAVSKKYNVSIEDIKSQKRQKNIMLARHVSVYILRQITDLSLPAIGKIFSRDHTTALSSINVIEEKIKTNKLLEDEIETLIREIKS